MKPIKASPRIECKKPCCTGMLFHLEAPPVKRKPTKTPAARYARYKPKTRTLCDDCIREIHRLGVAHAPLPQPVRWRRSDEHGSTHLCERHRDERVAQEQQ